MNNHRLGAATLVTLLFWAGTPNHLAAQSPPAPTLQLTPTSPQSEERNQPVTVEDLRILEKAEGLLKDESVWNRQDDRECQDDERAGKRSLFCALQQACIDVLGRYDHRRVALQEVRFAVEDATRGRDFEHRLRDFNNLPETTLADIKRVLRVAKERVTARLQAEVPSVQPGADVSIALTPYFRDLRTVRALLGADTLLFLLDTELAARRETGDRAGRGRGVY